MFPPLPQIRDWHPDVVRFALDNKADVNARDTLGRTPLHLACALDYHHVVALLLQGG